MPLAQQSMPENLGAVINTDAEEWGPYVDPDEDFLIFTSNRPGGFGLHDLYISFRNADGSWSEPQNMGNTINSSNDDASPLISPDGNYLFYLTKKEGDLVLNPYWVDAQIIENFRPGESGVIAYCYHPMSGSDLPGIYTINADGTGNKRISNAQIGLNHPDWSPDAEKIAVVGYASFNPETYSIYVFDADGNNFERLTNSIGVLDGDVSWSPDGTKIAFSRIFPAQNNRCEIWLMNADGSNQHWIGVPGFAARWSPDGTRFVYQSGHFLEETDIKTCNIDGTDEQYLTSTTDDEETPAWSPDGSQIAFSTNRDGNIEIYIMDSDGSNMHRLTYSELDDDYSPRWSPDGSRIAFGSGPSRESEIYIINTDGTNLKRVTNLPNDIIAINPVWRSGN